MIYQILLKDRTFRNVEGTDVDDETFVYYDLNTSTFIVTDKITGLALTLGTNKTSEDAVTEYNKNKNKIADMKMTNVYQQLKNKRKFIRFENGHVTLQGILKNVDFENFLVGSRSCLRDLIRLNVFKEFNFVAKNDIMFKPKDVYKTVAKEDVKSLMTKNELATIATVLYVEEAEESNDKVCYVYLEKEDDLSKLVDDLLDRSF